jgi:hypothetical protein
MKFTLYHKTRNIFRKLFVLYTKGSEFEEEDDEE